jgi:hypothetical protein
MRRAVAPPIDHDVSPGVLSAAAVVALAFGVYLWRRRRQLSRSASAVAVAKEPTGRSEGLSRLAAFAQALTRSAERSDVAAAAVTHLPLIVPNRRAWVMTRTAGVWEPLADVGDTPAADRERASRRATSEDGLHVRLPSDDECFAVLAEDAPACVVGVASHPPLTAHERSALAAAAAVLSVSVGNAGLRQRRDAGRDFSRASRRD